MGLYHRPWLSKSTLAPILCIPVLFTSFLIFINVGHLTLHDKITSGIYKVYSLAAACIPLIHEYTNDYSGAPNRLLFIGYNSYNNAMEAGSQHALWVDPDDHIPMAQLSQLLAY